MTYDQTDAELARREHDYEMGGDTPTERRWYAWAHKVEALLGIDDLDGDQIEDGYCLDFASEAFDDGFTPEQYADRVRDGWHVNGERA